MIKSCVFLPFSGEDACTSVIETAQNNLDNSLKDNLVQLMEALDDKMSDDGIVIFNGYAPFFNTENEDCSTNQDWTLLSLGSDPLTLTIERRKTFNNLVAESNGLIQGVVNDTAANSKYKWHIGYSNWGLWPVALGWRGGPDVRSGVDRRVPRHRAAEPAVLQTRHVHKVGWRTKEA